MQKLFILLIKFYQQYISIFLKPRCRFYPTCSQYMVEAVEGFGLKQGFLLGLKRISKCHPFHPGGVDLLVESKFISSGKEQK
jgi:uncharacterized protein